MVATWPSRAAMCRGVCPAVVAAFGLALCSSSTFTSSLCPIRAAQCSGVWSSCPGERQRVRVTRLQDRVKYISDATADRLVALILRAAVKHSLNSSLLSFLGVTCGKSLKSPHPIKSTTICTTACLCCISYRFVFIRARLISASSLSKMN